MTPLVGLGATGAALVGAGDIRRRWCGVAGTFTVLLGVDEKAAGGCCEDSGIANLPSKEPDAGNLHIRGYEGASG